MVLVIRWGGGYKITMVLALTLTYHKYTNVGGTWGWHTNPLCSWLYVDVRPTYYNVGWYIEGVGYVRAGLCMLRAIYTCIFGPSIRIQSMVGVV